MEEKINPIVLPGISKGIWKVLSIIKGKAMKTYDISNILYRDHSAEVMSRYFSSLPTALVFNFKSRYKKPEEPIEYTEQGAMINNTNIIDFTFYREVLLILTVKTYRGNDSSWSEDWCIQCLNNKHDRHMTVEFMKMINRQIRDECDKTQNERVSIVKNANCVVTQNNRPIRTWDDVFIPASMEDQICTALHKFVNGVDWYRKHRVPYHFGILLHGNPGTGKSSIVQAITQEIPCDVCVIPPGELAHALEEGIFTHYRELHRHHVVIIEDVDTNCFGNRIEKSKNEYEDRIRITDDTELLGRLLNYIDGYNSPDGTIWILTTNHVDKLDPALIRPGRIDLNLEIGYATDETFAKFMKFHYDVDVPSDHHVKDELLFGDLQTKVMLGWTLDQMLDYSRI